MLDRHDNRTGPVRDHEGKPVAGRGSRSCLADKISEALNTRGYSDIGLRTSGLGKALVLGHGDDRYVREALKLGGFHYVTKLPYGRYVEVLPYGRYVEVRP